jgi:hypothetical protein
MWCDNKQKQGGAGKRRISYRQIHERRTGWSAFGLLGLARENDTNGRIQGFLFLNSA